MKPSSRTPDGEPGRCPICGDILRLDPSLPPGDAPCPSCGSLVWFDSWCALGPIEDTPSRIRIEFRGGCKDQIVFDDAPRSLVEARGYRYYRLAKTAQFGTHFHEVPFFEYDKIRHVLVEHGHSADERFGNSHRRDMEQAVHNLSRTNIEQIAQRLQDVTVHVYEVIKRTEMIELLEVRLQFVNETHGL